jgi:hypothetical protein
VPIHNIKASITESNKNIPKNTLTLKFFISGLLLKNIKYIHHPIDSKTVTFPIEKPQANDANIINIPIANTSGIIKIYAPITSLCKVSPN